MCEAESKINEIAKQARIWLEWHYTDIFPDSMEGACAIASTYILKLLDDEKINAMVKISELAAGGNHAFVETNEYIIDITAQQFQDSVDRYLPDIIVTNKNSRKEYFWDNVVARLRTPMDVVYYTMEPAWPDEQIPNLALMEIAHDDF